ncbi:hypothetical protein H8356DRAFT_1029523 [Neocallimastix lanati (nom. inval.)]|jgi:hypothetical protein|uniref:Tetraspannin-domain-containing protein n=1 Tax=Neocallimastix californiae TaxID=1754190 RepID=A0A1Y2FVI0_9FUNG|nr:hypothetical protein H8356DRAFT_927272 [Neocallimastix sp. JGI-2020a]KAG4104269.1 hypothetical protein H8356DRAFT_1029523 [Neocallimastix sp. JGI-2020a]ORY87314.1 hypothetical protein LY90DRAFT_663028 [Neocallimastix californiae]|eukprot:ORY87314.1 hypothetical protein LY90DRAFT_663028 [Neocallimastix californiae]
MANTKSDFKRRFPKVGKCCCCCEPKVSVIVCTIIFIIWLGLGAFYAGISFNIVDKYNTSTTSIISKVLIVINICVLISLILLLVGIIKRNITFMNQFKFVFIIFIISQLFNYAYSIYLFNDDEYIGNAIKTLKKTYKQNNLQGFYEIPDEIYRRSLKSSMYYYIVEYLIILALIVYYYLSTCSYIEDVEEIANEENDTRKLENNEY